jgi:hypothetical protein
MKQDDLVGEMKKDDSIQEMNQDDLVGEMKKDDDRIQKMNKKSAIVVEEMKRDSSRIERLAKSGFEVKRTKKDGLVEKKMKNNGQGVAKTKKVGQVVGKMKLEKTNKQHLLNKHRNDRENLSNTTQGEFSRSSFFISYIQCYVSTNIGHNF